VSERPAGERPADERAAEQGTAHERTAGKRADGGRAADEGRSLATVWSQMRWADIASRDLLEIRRSRIAIALALVLPLLTILPAWVRWFSYYDPPLPAEQAIFTVSAVLALVLPLVVLIATYGSLLTERQAGRIRVTMGLPVSRLEVFGGKYAARVVLVLGTLGVALTVTGGFVATTTVPFSAVDFAGFAFVTMLYAAVWVGLGLGVSGGVASTTRGVAGIVGTYVLFRLGWPALQYVGLHLGGGRTYAPYPEWYYAFGRLNPMNAYLRAVQPFMPNAGRFHPLLSRGEGAGTLWTSHEVALAVLVVWVALAPALGYLWFQRADL
jgi:ABC-2 type transport system permease protein